MPTEGTVIGNLPQNISVIWKGRGELIIGEGVTTKRPLVITIGDESTVSIGKGVQFFGETTLYFRDGSSCSIGDNCIVIDTRIICEPNSHIKIGDDTTINDRSTLICRRGYSINIGRDCMLSQEVLIHAGDGHPIYDTKTQRIINDPSAESPKRSVVLESHVWIGWGATLLHGAHVHLGSIVAARALVNKSCPNNSLIAGFPASVKKVDVGWKRYRGCQTPDAYLETTHPLDK